MSRFYLILISLLLAVFILTFSLKIEIGAYPILFNFLLLPLGILAYLRGAGLGLAGAAICVLFLLVYVFYINASLISVMPALFAFIITPVAFGVLKKVFLDMKSYLTEDLRRSKKAAEILGNRDMKLGSELRELDRRVSDITSLYEITKEMSATLLFGEIFKILSEFLKKNFKFVICKLLLVAQNQEGRTIEKVYKLEGGSPILSKPELIDNEILNEMSKAKELIYWEDFIAIPLISQNKVIGILNVEELEAPSLEKFLIVSRQFSLAMEKVRLYETVQEFAITDGLTAVFVRRYFLDMLKEELERSLRHNFKLAFLMVDLDHFKNCNDRFGHLVGDVILREVAKVLKRNVREIDLLGRYGGEEFSLFLPETDKGGAMLVSERLREAVASQNFKAYDEILKMTISIGVAVFPDDASTGAELIEAADGALYDAKAQGRNRVVAFKPR